MQKNVFTLGALTFALAACGGGSDSGGETMGETGDDTYVLEAATDQVTEAAEATPMQSPVSPPTDPIRGPGGMEEKCLSRVNDTVGGGVIGTNRIEEAESGVMIYVNVQGATAPWQCFGSRDGTISEVYFGGSEGDL
uniref:hypothetical protein n=1 Tax=uncultured Altererythrobacter sp. TaxID=500840 RepID=UPI002616D33E|nr:hypothetical protein [uncultured Altererythrobacter sp.]